MQRCEEKRTIPKVILVPLDGSEVATSILQQVVALARRSEVRLLLLTVGLPMLVLPSQASEMPPSRTFQAEAYLDHSRANLAADHKVGRLTACQVTGQDGCLGHGECSRSGACLPSGTYIACLIQRTICQRGENPTAFWHVRRSLWTNTENYASNL
jgi:hypothetical protein